MKPLNITQNKLAKDIDMPQNIINQIINDEHKITTDIALRLGKYFNIEPEFWLNLQNRFDFKPHTLMIVPYTGVAAPIFVSVWWHLVALIALLV